MPRRILIPLTIAALLVAPASSASANDIVDFLKAVQSARHSAAHRQHHPHHGRSGRIAVDRQHDHYRGRGTLSSRDIYKRHQRFAENHERFGYGSRLSGRDYDFARRRSLSVHRPSATVTFRVGRSYPSEYAPLHGGFPAPQGPVYGYPVAPVPVQPVPHRIGEIIDCDVPLFTHVRVKDPDHIAPGAVPVVVAVRDPNLCRHSCTCCEERLVYVEICVPPCPMQKLRISPCRTYMKLDYGDYEVEITSRDGCITVDYDD